MGQEQGIDFPDGNFELEEPHRNAAPGVDEQFLISGFDQCTRSEAVGARNRNAGAEKSDAKITLLAHC